MSMLNIETIMVLEKYKGYGGKECTYSTYIEAKKITHNKNEVYYFIPYGCGVECDDGHYIDVIDKNEFEKKYSTVPLR